MAPMFKLSWPFERLLREKLRTVKQIWWRELKVTSVKVGKAEKVWPWELRRTVKKKKVNSREASVRFRCRVWLRSKELLANQLELWVTPGDRRCGRGRRKRSSRWTSTLGKACSTSTGGSCAGYMIPSARIASSTFCIERANWETSVSKKMQNHFINRQTHLFATVKALVFS